MLGVVVGHSFGFAKIASHVTGGLSFQGAGLDIFFIISGLLVWRLSRTRETHPALFFLHRLSRLAPLYWIATLTYVAFISVMGRGMVHESSPPTFSELLKSLLFVPYYNSFHAIAPVLEPGWTLSFDVWYFLIFAAVLSVPRKVQLGFATAVYGAIPMLHLIGLDAPIARVLTHPRALDFLAGIWIAYAIERDILLPRAVSIITASASIGMMIGFIILGVPSWGVTFVCWAGAGCVGTYAMASVEGRGGPFKWFPQARILGDSSYSIYLLQPLAIATSCMFVPGGVWPKFIVGVLTSLGIGIIAHFAVEQPINAFLKRVERSRGLRPQASITVAP